MPLAAITRQRQKNKQKALKKRVAVAGSKPLRVETPREKTTAPLKDSEKLDILGVRLGMKIDQVETILKPHFSGRKIKIFHSIDRKVHGAKVRKALEGLTTILDENKEKILNNITGTINKKRPYLTEGVLYELINAGKLNEQIVAFHMPGDADKKIIAIGRGVNLKAGQI